MVDLTGYRCLVSVNYLSDIPENLEITVGDYSLSVLIQLERWGRRDAPALATHPTRGPISTTPVERPRPPPPLCWICKRPPIIGRRFFKLGCVLEFVRNPGQAEGCTVSYLFFTTEILPTPANSKRQPEDESTTKGPAIVERRAATDWNLNFSDADADAALNEIPDAEGGRSIIAAADYFRSQQEKIWCMLLGPCVGTRS
uniref:Uncharacterized protein n=1 Tax=Ananas comosus var. bracteatus TaxID=296719 RepID=A0A6V7NKM9_ANACO|nr:unnamed protein product [Ananas comosus var. bracteatus]